MRLPDKDDLTRVMAYDAGTGQLTWRAREASDFPQGGRLSAESQCRSWNTKYAGKPAFRRVTARGYLCGTVFGRQELAHRIIWKMVYGQEPEMIDHLNGIQTDNRLENLRAANAFINQRNAAIKKTNSTGTRGVSFDRRAQKWKVTIGGQYIGVFASRDAAGAARAEAARSLGYHERPPCEQDRNSENRPSGSANRA